MYKRGGLCQSLIYCLQRPNLPFMDFLNISPLPAGTISVSEAAGETLPEEGVFPLGSGGRAGRLLWPALCQHHLLCYSGFVEESASIRTLMNHLPWHSGEHISSKFWRADF